MQHKNKIPHTGHFLRLKMVFFYQVGQSCLPDPANLQPAFLETIRIQHVRLLILLFVVAQQLPAYISAEIFKRIDHIPVFSVLYSDTTVSSSSQQSRLGSGSPRY